MGQDADRLHRTLFQNAPDAIIYADTNGHIFFWNTGAERIFGFSSSEAVGNLSTSLSRRISGNVIGTGITQRCSPGRPGTAPAIRLRSLLCERMRLQCRSSSLFCRFLTMPGSDRWNCSDSPRCHPTIQRTQSVAQATREPALNGRIPLTRPTTQQENGDEMVYSQKSVQDALCRRGACNHL